MEKNKLVNDNMCILLQFCDDPSKKAVGFRNWLKEYRSTDDIRKLIENGEAVTISWPSSEIYPAKKMAKIIDKLQPGDWKPQQVQILDTGNWINMHEQLYSLEKTRLKASKNKIEVTLTKSDDLLNQNQFHEITDAEGKSSSEYITEDEPHKKKKKRKRSSTDNYCDESTVIAKKSSTDAKKKKKKQLTEDNNDERGLSDDASMLLGALDDQTTVHDEEEKKKKKKKKKSKKVLEDGFSEENNLEEKKTANQVTGDKATEIKNKLKKKGKNDTPELDTGNGVIVEEYSSNTVQKENDSNHTSSGKNNLIAQNSLQLNTPEDPTTLKSSRTLETPIPSNLLTSQVSEKDKNKLKDKARKNQTKQTSSDILQRLAKKKLPKMTFEHESTESISSEDESRRKRTKKQLESDVTILMMENKNLRNQLAVHRNTEKALEASRTLVENLKQCQTHMRKLKVVCSKCGSNDTVEAEVESTSFPSASRHVSQSYLESRVRLPPKSSQTIMLDKVDNSNETIEAYSVPARKDSKETVPDDMTISTTNTNNVENLTGDGCTKQKNGDNNIPVPMTEIGPNISIPTSIVTKFRTKKVRHYLLDMVKAVYSDIEFATCSKTGRSKLEKKNKIDTTKQEAIADYTAEIFPDTPKNEIVETLSNIITNKMKNAGKKSTKPNVKAEDKTAETAVEPAQITD